MYASTNTKQANQFNLPATTAEADADTTVQTITTTMPTCTKIIKNISTMKQKNLSSELSSMKLSTTTTIATTTTIGDLSSSTITKPTSPRKSSTSPTTCASTLPSTVFASTSPASPQLLSTSLTMPTSPFIRRSQSVPLLKIDDVEDEERVRKFVGTELNCDKKFKAPTQVQCKNGASQLQNKSKGMTADGGGGSVGVSGGSLSDKVTATTITLSAKAKPKATITTKVTTKKALIEPILNITSSGDCDSDRDTPMIRQTRPDRSFGCSHYKRRAMFVTPCCNKFYMCRFCHDANESHHFDRKTLNELICCECKTRQKVQEACVNCGVRFGRYTCLVCNLFDDEDKKQYHCDACGICRIGGGENFFHCEVCNMCLPIQLKIDGHKCVENVSRSHCPVCLGDIHTSRIPCHIPDCGHLLHKMCFDQLLDSGHYTCPICQTSLIDMTALWDFLDIQASQMPMPKIYENQRIHIFCNDCQRTSKTNFHYIGLKCMECGAYNTTQDVKRRVSLVPDEPNTA